MKLRCFLICSLLALSIPTYAEPIRLIDLFYDVDDNARNACHDTFRLHNNFLLPCELFGSQRYFGAAYVQGVNDSIPSFVNGHNLLSICTDRPERFLICDFYFFRWGECPVGSIPHPDTGECLTNNQAKDVGQVCANESGGTNPINLSVGNKYESATDYVGNERFPLSVSRSYNSLRNGWRFLPEIDFQNGQGVAAAIRPDGKEYRYYFNSDLGWVADRDVPDTLEGFIDFTAIFSGWRYITLAGQVEDYDDQGRLITVTDRSGISHTYDYTDTAITVTHSLGSVLVYQLDNDGQITGFIDPDGERYIYDYDVNGNLASITYPAEEAETANTRVYHYEDVNFPNALTGITDETGARYATWAYDQQGRAVSSEHTGGADRVIADYTHIDDADSRVTITNALGKQTTIHFETVQRRQRATLIEGHPTATCPGLQFSNTYPWCI